MKTPAMVVHNPDVSVLDAIYKRRAVRAYTQDDVSHDTVQQLLTAAVHAPTALHEEPWVFSVIQNRKVLRQLSDRAKKLVKKEFDATTPQGKHALEHVADDKFNIFYDAGTLIIVWAKPMGAFVAADCWLAAENLMLAACGMNLGTCVIGFAVSALNTPEWKTKLGVHEKMTAIAPIIVGVPRGETPLVPRKAPEIASWL